MNVFVLADWHHGANCHWILELGDPLQAPCAFSWRMNHLISSTGPHAHLTYIQLNTCGTLCFCQVAPQTVRSSVTPLVQIWEEIGHHGHQGRLVRSMSRRLDSVLCRLIFFIVTSFPYPIHNSINIHPDCFYVCFYGFIVGGPKDLDSSVLLYLLSHSRPIKMNSWVWPLIQ